jgi:hypothetical protein
MLKLSRNWEQSQSCGNGLPQLTRQPEGYIKKQKEVQIMAKTRKDWSAEISARFIAELENGKIPWIKPWDDWASWNRDSGKDYNGINQLMLSGGEFATFNQIKKAGGKVNKGAHGERVVFYKEYFKIPVCLGKNRINASWQILFDVIYRYYYRDQVIHDLTFLISIIRNYDKALLSSDAKLRYTPG